VELPVAPAGILPASSAPGAAVPPAARPAPILAPKIDPVTGARQALFEGDDPVYAAIVAAFRTVRGSGIAVADTGQRFEDVRKNSTDAPELIRYEVERILSPYQAAGQIRIDSIEPEAGPDKGWIGRVRARFTILRTGEEREAFA
jgi:hypothetical protein